MPYGNEADEYQAAVSSLDEAFRTGIRAFAEWFAREWQITPEEWKKAYEEPVPDSEWFKGHNTGVEGILVAVDSFLGDFHP